VVPRSPRIPALVGSRGWKVGVRLPDHPVPRELARRIGGPITGTSANRTGGPDPRAAADVRAQLGDRVDLVLEEGGSPPRGHASTVLDITGPVPRVLRLGAISASALEQVCRSPVVSGGDGVGP
jgi:L-threonylcarbamoyladenylate synthase